MAGLDHDFNSERNRCLSEKQIEICGKQIGPWKQTKQEKNDGEVMMVSVPLRSLPSEEPDLEHRVCYAHKQH